MQVVSTGTACACLHLQVLPSLWARFNSSIAVLSVARCPHHCSSLKSASAEFRRQSGLFSLAGPCAQEFSLSSQRCRVGRVPCVSVVCVGLAACMPRIAFRELVCAICDTLPVSPLQNNSFNKRSFPLCRARLLPGVNVSRSPHNDSCLASPV